MQLYSIFTHIISESPDRIMACGTKIIVEDNKCIVCVFTYGFMCDKNIVNVT
jgi:hypothetical protein